MKYSSGFFFSRFSTSPSSASVEREPSCAQSVSARPAKNGSMPPQWCVMMRSFGSLSKKPEKTMRAIATLVSNGQPSTCQISYFDFGSPA